MNPIHLPLTGHDLLAVERYHDDTRHIIEFLVFADCPMGKRASITFCHVLARNHLTKQYVLDRINQIIRFGGACY